MYNKIEFVIGNGTYFPKLCVKKLHENGSFLYCVALLILDNGKDLEICHCDNYDNKGSHIHFMARNGKQKREEKIDGGLGNAIDYLSKNWKQFIETMEDE